MRAKVIATAVLFLVGVLGLYAQSTISGYATGVVADASGALVRGATVTLQSTATSSTQSTATNAEGAYRFEFVPPGDYTLTVRAAGFSAWHTAITVTVGQSSTTNAQLTVGSSASVVDVSAESAAVSTEDGNISTNFNEAQIRVVPNPGQDLTYVAQAAPGAVMNTQHGGGNFSVFGLPGYSNMFTINGMDYLSTYGNNNKSGATNNSLGTNEMQSVTVVNNGYSGNYGRLVGSNVNYVSKSGANEFHGNAVYNWNGSTLNANDYFNNLHGTPRPFDNVNQWAASAGGPIWKNHTFFFVNNEGLRIVIPTTNAVNIPSPQFEAATLANLASVSAGSIPLYNKIFALYNGAGGASRAQNILANGGCGNATFEATIGGPCALQFQSTPSNFSGEWLLSWRVDQIISAKDQTFLRIQTDHGIQATTTSPFNPIFNNYSPQPEWQGQWNETHTFSGRAVNQAIAAFQWSNILSGPTNIPGMLSAFPTQLSFSGSSLTNLGNSLAALSGRAITQYQIVDDFSISVGRHTIKIGEDFLRDDLSVHTYGTNTAGVLTTSLANFYAGQATTFNKSFPNTLNSRFNAYDIGIYVEDDWRVAANLKLTAAIRLDRDANISSQANGFARLADPFESTEHDPTIPYNQTIESGINKAFYDTTAFSFQPRLGFAWSPLGSASTVIRGGIGNFADTFPQSVLGNFAFNPPNVNTFTVKTGFISPDVANNVFDNASSSQSTFINGFSQGWTLAQIQAANPAFVPPAYFGAQKFTTVPTYLEWNLEVEHSFGSATTVSANYVGNHGIHEAFRNPNLNAYDPTLFNGLPAAAIDPRFSTVTELQTVATSNYTGLVVSATHKFNHGFQASANYTYSHSLDDVSDNGFSAASGGTDASIVFPQTPLNPHSNYGNSDYDVRHSFNASYIWSPVVGPWAGHGKKALSGWSFAGTFFARTGLPFTVVDTATTATLGKFNYGGTVFANYLGGAQPGCTDPTSSCLVASDFSAAGTLAGFGNQRRNQFRGPGFCNTDLSVLKSFKVPFHGEGQEFVFGASFYNILNHPNFDQPTSDVANAQFGNITKTVSTPTGILGAGLGGDSSPRQIQLTAKLIF
jgi:Carboxypeptidase regulatory-like domain